MAKAHMQGNVDIGEFRKHLKKVIERNTSVDDLRELLKSLLLFEQKYGMKSQVFYDKFMLGEMGDARDFIQWAGKYEMFLRLEAMIEKRIQIVEDKRCALNVT